jgi:hypothetical protein
MAKGWMSTVAFPPSGWVPEGLVLKHVGEGETAGALLMAPPNIPTDVVVRVTAERHRAGLVVVVVVVVPGVLPPKV